MLTVHKYITLNVEEEIYEISKIRFCFINCVG